jgi:hypothetical protein
MLNLNLKVVKILQQMLYQPVEDVIKRRGVVIGSDGCELLLEQYPIGNK